MNQDADSNLTRHEPAGQKNNRELCPEQIDIDLLGCRPSRNAIHMATVYECESPEEASLKLGGKQSGYVYMRDGHPNADALAEKCRRLHAAEHAVMTASGMAATSVAILAHLKSGDHIVISDRMYGGTSVLVERELSRLGVTATQANSNELDEVERACADNTRMLIVETIANPMLQIAPLTGLADIAQKNNAVLVVDNTFASPIVCRPLEHGAHLVIESLTKMMNGHGDVTMGLLCGKTSAWERVESTLACWGMTTNPFECWLAERGLATLFLRMKTACETAEKVANRLLGHPGLSKLVYPSLNEAPNQSILCAYEGQTLFGNMITIELSGEGDQATGFISRLNEIPFCPSLGDFSTTLSHPASSSHRNLTSEQQRELGFGFNTIRLSVGLEDPNYLSEAILGALEK